MPGTAVEKREEFNAADKCLKHIVLRPLEMIKCSPFDHVRFLMSCVNYKFGRVDVQVQSWCVHIWRKSISENTSSLLPGRTFTERLSAHPVQCTCVKIDSHHGIGCSYRDYRRVPVNPNKQACSSTHERYKFSTRLLNSWWFWFIHIRTNRDPPLLFAFLVCFWSDIKKTKENECCSGYFSVQIPGNPFRLTAYTSSMNSYRLQFTVAVVLSRRQKENIKIVICFFLQLEIETLQDAWAVQAGCGPEESMGRQGSIRWERRCPDFVILFTHRKLFWLQMVTAGKIILSVYLTSTATLVLYWKYTAILSETWPTNKPTAKMTAAIQAYLK